MEPVTHLAAGLLISQSLRPRLETDARPARGLAALCAVAATIPDIDVLSGWLGPEAYMLHHRGLTHSLPALPVLALLLALAARLFGATLPFRAAFLAACLSLASHVFLDVVTAFGTQLFAPFSDLRVSVEGLYYVDPPFALALLALAFLARRGSAAPPERKLRLALAGLALLALYPALGMALRANVQWRYEAHLAARGQAFDRVVATPDALSPYHWKVVVESGPDMLVTTANLLDIAAEYPALSLKRADREELRRLGREASIFGTFAWFAEFPFAEPPRVESGRTAVRFADASFLNSGPALKALFGDGPVFAEITALLDATGRLIAWRDENGREHAIAGGP